MKFIYPQGKKKALTFSYDDNQIFDKRLVEIFNRYGLKGTFHINSGRLNVEEGGNVFIKSEELKALYAGQEVACHGVEHKNLTYISDEQIVLEVQEDRKALEAITGTMVQGMSYAYGAYEKNVEKIISSLGIKYCRTVKDTFNFFPPANFLEWHPTCHHNHQLQELGDRFLNLANYYELPLMYVWGHSFEFHRENNWEVIERFAEKMSGKDDIWYATNIEIYHYLQAVRMQEFSADGLNMYNPTLLSVWVSTEKGNVEVKPGETVFLGE